MGYSAMVNFGLIASIIAKMMHPDCQAPLVMCKDLWRFPLEWGNGNKHGKNNQRRAFEMGISNSERGDAVSRCG